MRKEYQAAGVPENWIVDIPRRAITIHYFAQGKLGQFRGDETFESAVLKSLDLACQFTALEVFEVLD
ncbi:MAG: hypothetical protein HYU36_17190 [Planctomycetes bacterium]|nr:hypothetical protein [Planctomycetota bacterium]